MPVGQVLRLQVFYIETWKLFWRLLLFFYYVFGCIDVVCWTNSHYTADCKYALHMFLI